MLLVMPSGSFSQGLQGHIRELALPWFLETFNFRKVSCKFFFARNPLVYAVFARLAKISFDNIVFLCRLWIIQSEGLTFANLKLNQGD
jgi:hypothetical protein